MIEPVCLRFLLVALLLVVWPHLFHLHWSHVALFLGFWAWRWLGIARPRLLPRGPWLPLLTLAAAVVVIVSRRGAIDLATSTGLFVAGLGLKLMELKRDRDVHIVVLLGWFVALTQFLYDQSLLMTLYAFAAAALLTAAAVRFEAATRLGWRPLVRTVAGLMFPALPLAVLLFLFFPRPPTGFVHLSFGATARTGLADVMEPGAVARLATSSELAFRVDFEDEPPPPTQRYWRAQVFWRFDGRRWLRHPAMEQPRPRPLPGQGRRYRYWVTVEPHHRRWLFSLGVPATVPAPARLTRDGVLRARAPVDERLRYEVVSRESYRFPALTLLERNLALQLPGRPSPEVVKLLAELRRGADGPEALAAAVLSWFREQEFRYTLRPGTLGPRPVDEFLFQRRAGFCEHYASAFVYLMRAAGVPARVVAGYLGGFLNPRGRFLEVYQANAHAWAEIWVEGKGWVRVDPTAAVAPAYVEQVQDLPDPVTVAMPSPQQVLEGREAPASTPVRRSLRSLAIFWGDLEHRWHRWVLGYDRNVQARLFAWLGKRWPAVAFGLAAVLALVAFRRRTGGRRDPLQAAYEAFLRRMRRDGLVKAPHETPLAFARRAAARRPQRAAGIRAVTEAFLEAHYGRGDRRRAARRIRATLRRW